jgi:hypothetical protein
VFDRRRHPTQGDCNSALYFLEEWKANLDCIQQCGSDSGLKSMVSSPLDEVAEPHTREVTKNVTSQAS